MKKLIAVLILGTLVACNNHEPKSTATNENMSVELMTEVEQVSVTLSNNEREEFYSTTLNINNEVKDVFVERLNQPKQIEDNLYHNFVFYVADQEDSEAVVQQDLAIYSAELENLGQITFDTIEFQGATILIAIHPIVQDINEIYAWGLEDGGLKELTFDGEEYVLSASSESQPYKVMKDHYVQTFKYSNLKEKLGWIFTTWIFDTEQVSFHQHDVTSYENNEDGRFIGEYLANKWITFDEYYVQFPYYTFSQKDMVKLERGYLPEMTYPIGTPIEDVLETYTIFEEDYYNGGHYYETKDGLYFRDELTDRVAVLSISGKQLINGHDLESILGKPTSLGRSDMAPDEIYAYYTFDDYGLWIIYDEHNNVSYIELHLIKDK